MLKLYRLLLVFFVLIGCEFYCLQAQVKENYPFQHIRNGIPQNSATVIFEDSYGFLWIGTPNGINKYNGTDFEGDAKILEVKNYRTLAQTDSLLWLGSYSHGLFKYNIETGAVKQFLLKEKLLMKKETDNLISKVQCNVDGAL